MQSAAFVQLGSLAASPSAHGLRNEMHFSTKWLQTMLRCIRLISGKAALSHYCHQTSGVNHIPGEADSCKVVISLRNPWASTEPPKSSAILIRRKCSMVLPFIVK